MAKRGRKRKPTSLKLVTGNPGKRDLGDVEDELDPGGEPTPPKSVMADDDVMEIWKQYAPMLAELGVLTAADSHNFAVWCHLAAEFENYPRGMPAAKINAMRALASSFGMDPSSRAGRPSKPKGKADPEDRFFGRG